MNQDDMFQKPEVDRELHPAPKRPEAPAFVKWYTLYPLKKSRGSALKAWEKLTKGMTPEEEESFSLELRNATKAQIKRYQELKSAGEFVPPWKHPATWLNGMCWEDELTPVGSLFGAPNTGTCSVEGCNEPCHGPRFRMCAWHFTMRAESKRGLTVTGNDILERCKK